MFDMGRILGTDELYVQNARVAIVVSMFNEQITTLLHSGAVSTATKYGADPEALDTYWVTGAFEIPLIALELAESGRYEAICGLGAIIRGETPHFDFVASETGSGIMRACIDSRVPISFGILTTDNLGDASERSGGRVGNKGEEAMYAALHSASLIRSIRAEQSV